MIVRRTLVALAVAAAVVLVAIPTAVAGRPAASFYTPQQLQVMSERYSAKAAFDALTPQQRRALTDSWEQQASLIRGSESSSSGFGWADFGIGAAAMLGLVLLAGGLTFAARQSKSRRVQPRFGS